MKLVTHLSCLILVLGSCSVVYGAEPFFIATWSNPGSIQAAYEAVVTKKGSCLDGLEKGISFCEDTMCHHSVGYGSHPDETGETTLDSMIMYGPTHDIGAVGCLRNIKSAVSVARKVLENTENTLLVGEKATDFAVEMGFKKQDLHTNYSRQEYGEWKMNKCQPNYWKNVTPDPKTTCGPYSPIGPQQVRRQRPNVNSGNHDTIGMIVMDSAGNLATATSTNGLTHKIAGRVGDSPIPGSGCYVDQEVGAAASTGDGDIMMRFVPSYQAVESMRQGLTPQEAADDAIKRIGRKYPKFEGAIIVTNLTGSMAASCHGMDIFPFTIASSTGNISVKTINCFQN